MTKICLPAPLAVRSVILRIRLLSARPTVIRNFLQEQWGCPKSFRGSEIPLATPSFSRTNVWCLACTEEPMVMGYWWCCQRCKSIAGSKQLQNLTYWIVWFSLPRRNWPKWRCSLASRAMFCDTWLRFGDHSRSDCECLGNLPGLSSVAQAPQKNQG